MASETDSLVLDYLRRIDDKLDRLLQCFALSKGLSAPKREIASPQKADRLDELLDAFEKLSPEERRRDLERANEFLRMHGVEGLDRLDELLPAREEPK